MMDQIPINQFDYDRIQFSELFSKFTGISKTKIYKYINEGNIRNIIEHPSSLEGISKTQLERINNLKELQSIYHNLKKHDKEYKITSTKSAGDYFMDHLLNQKDKERFVCSFLDNSNRIIATKSMFQGTVNEAPVYPREIVKLALTHDAKSVILAHNHPGGSLNPSKADIALTNSIVNALSTVNINVLDHIIVADDKYISFAEDGIPLESSTNTIREMEVKYMNCDADTLSKDNVIVFEKYISKERTDYIKYLNTDEMKLVRKASDVVLKRSLDSKIADKSTELVKEFTNSISSSKVHNNDLSDQFDNLLKASETEKKELLEIREVIEKFIEIDRLKDVKEIELKNMEEGGLHIYKAIFPNKIKKELNGLKKQRNNIVWQLKDKFGIDSMKQYNDRINEQMDRQERLKKMKEAISNNLEDIEMLEKAQKAINKCKEREALDVIKKNFGKELSEINSMTQTEVKGLYEFHKLFPNIKTYEEMLELKTSYEAKIQDIEIQVKEIEKINIKLTNSDILLKKLEQQELIIEKLENNIKKDLDILHKAKNKKTDIIKILKENGIETKEELGKQLIKFEAMVSKKSGLMLQLVNLNPKLKIICKAIEIMNRVMKKAKSIEKNNQAIGFDRKM